MIHKQDKWTGREYIGVESDLLVNGNRYLQIDDNANITTINSISFIIEANTLLGQFFKRGATVINISDLNLTVGQKTHVVYSGNGRIYKNSQDVGAHALNFSTVGNIEIGNGGSNNEDFKVSHFACFDASLSQSEVSICDDQGGVIDVNTWDSCVAYYPLTERYAYDDTTFFRFFDCVEQFNVSKVSGLTANHAKAINYTADELGTVNPKLATFKKDFYEKERNYWGILDFNNYRTLISKIVGGVFDPLDGTNEDFTLTFEGVPTVTVNQSYYFFECGSTFRMGFSIVSGNYVLTTYFDNGSAKLSANFDGLGGRPLIPVGTKKTYIFQIKRLSTDLQLLVDGIIVASTGAFQSEGTIFATDRIQFFMDRGPAVRTSAIAKRIVFAQGDISIDNFKNSTYPSNVFVDLNFNKIEGTSIVDDGLFGTIALRTDVTQASADYIPESSLTKGGGAYLEKNLLLPAITQGLNITTGKQVSGSYTSINGVVISYRGAANITAITDIITGLPAINRILVNGVVEADILKAFNDGNLVDVVLEFSAPFTGSINFVHTGINYNISRVASITDTLEFKEAFQLANNSLLANPDLSLQGKTKNYHLFNTGNISATPDNTDLIGSVALTLTGWSDQADVQSNIVDLNTLR